MPTAKRLSEKGSDPLGGTGNLGQFEGGRAPFRTAAQPFKFGLWIQLPPFVPLKGEGIVTVLAEIILAATGRSDTKVVVAMAKWTEDLFKSLLRDHRIPLDRVEFLISRKRLPLLVRLRRFLHTRHKKPPRPSLLSRLKWAVRRIPGVAFLWQRLWGAAGAAFRKALATDSFLVAGCCSLLALVLLLGFGPPLLLLWGLQKVFLRNVLVDKLWTGLQSLHRRWVGNRILAMRTRWVQWLAWAHNTVMEDEFRLLAREAFARQDVQVWYVPHPTAVQALAIGRPIVVAVPDLVYADFPTVFNWDAVKPTDKRIRDLIENANAMVTYCDYVRQEHVVRQLGREVEATRVIPHAAMDLRPHLRAATKQYDGSSDLAALALIRDFVLTEYRPVSWTLNVPADYLRTFPFDEVEFLFVSSQIRPYKNYMNLFRAFEILLRRKHLNLKLFFTGRTELNTPETIALRQFIAGAHLELDIISVPDLPPEVHAAFYRLAKLTIVPTLFEGGFPFPFTESLSVGTPVLMSSIPVTRETLPPELAQCTLFDPYDVQDMADRIAWGVRHREELLARQMPFYAQLCGRTWDRVLEEYLAVFRQALGTKGQKATHREAVSGRAALPSAA
jgi:glycosyltransferase involved in cell wall biosynthesis